MRKRTQLFGLAILFSLLAPLCSQGKVNPTYKSRPLNVVADELPTRAENNAQRIIPGVLFVRPTSGQINARYREGIDVSRYQGYIDWNRVGAEGGISYVYIKATEGSALVDPYYATNLYGARQAGLSVGSYHFYRPQIDIYEQLANLTTIVQKHEQDLVPLIDIETTGGVSHDKFVSDLQVFVERVTAFYGRRPLLYTYQNFYNKHLVGTFPGYQWMIAKYHREEPYLDDETDYMMWQYTQTGRIPGIRVNVDRSRIMGIHALSALRM